MKKAISYLAIAVISALVGWYARTWYTSQSGTPIEIIIPDSIIAAENSKLDSIQTLVENLEKNRETIKDSIVYITKWRTVEVSKVKSLPLDSGIIFLREKLRDYEN